MLQHFAFQASKYRTIIILPVVGTATVLGTEYAELFSAGSAATCKFAVVVVARVTLATVDSMAPAEPPIMSETFTLPGETRMIPFASRKTQVPTNTVIKRYTNVVINIAKNVPLGMDFDASYK